MFLNTASNPVPGVGYGSLPQVAIQPDDRLGVSFSFSAGPNPVTAGSSLTLTASSITDANPGATITQVTFGRRAQYLRPAAGCGTMLRSLPTPDLHPTRAAVMTIAFQCSGCGATLRVHDAMAGRRGKCPKCDAVNSIPGGGGQLQTAPPAPKAAAARAPKEAPPPEPAEEGEEAATEPRPKRKAAKKRGSRKLLFVGLGCGAALLLTCLGVGAGVGIWWYRSSSPISEELTYMPGNCEIIASVRVDQILASGAYQQLEREFAKVKQTVGPELEKETGLQAANVERVVVGGTMSGGEQPLVVVRTKQPVNAENLIARMGRRGFTGEPLGKFVFYGTGHDGLCVVSPKLVLFGSDKGVRAALRRNKKPDFSEGLKAAMKEADFSKTVTVAGVVPRSSAARPAGAALVDFRGMMPFGGDGDVVGMVWQAKVGNDVSLTLTLLCKDAVTAAAAKKKLDTTLTKLKSAPQIPPDLRNFLDLKLSVSGNKVTTTTDLKVAPLIQTYKNLAGGGGMK